MKNITDKIQISVIIPFYQGNHYLYRLMESINKTIDSVSDIADFEVIIINDSPTEMVVLPNNSPDIVKVFKNEFNFGIQCARINGLRKASGEFIVFLDQDDELIPNGFREQISLCDYADVVVGNGIYSLGKVNKKIYQNQRVMKYLINEKNFISIRNLIPSPGECLIKRTAIPEEWTISIINTNGADDWFLWLLLFKKKAKFVCNAEHVYKHNDSEGSNLSADLEKMKTSSIEMAEILKEKNAITPMEYKTLIHAINFKNKQDTKRLKVIDLFKYNDSLVSNIIYRLKVNTLILLGN